MPPCMSARRKAMPEAQSRHILWLYSEEMYGMHLRCEAQLFAVTVFAPDELLLSEENDLL